MNRDALYSAGIAMGRAHILKIGSRPDDGGHLNQAATFYSRCGLAEQARAAVYRAQHWRASMPDDIAAEIQESQRIIPLPDQHAFNAGVNLGWSIETTKGRQIEDVRYVAAALDRLQAHVAALNPSHASQIDSLVNAVKSPIVLLMNAQHPKPRELPNHLGPVEGLQASLRPYVKG